MEDSRIRERLAIIETNQTYHKASLDEQTHLLETINDKLGDMQSSINVHSAVIENVRTEVADNKTRVRFLPNLIVTVIITVVLSAWISKASSLASQDPVQPKTEIHKESE